MTTVAEFVGAQLSRAGCRCAYGTAWPGIEHVDVTDDAIAALLADADGRLGPAPGVAVLSNQRLRISSKPGGVAEEIPVTDIGQVEDALRHAWAGAASTTVGSATLRFDVALDAPMRAVVDVAPLTMRPPTARPGRHDARLDGPKLDGPKLDGPELDGRVAMLVGPGVVRAGAVDSLQRFAAAASLGVANTWGAKGVFRWDSPHHMGTVGLQARDFELLGFAELDALLAVGIDIDESPRDRFALAPVIELSPHALETLPTVGARAPGPAGTNALYERIAAVAQPGYASSAMPLHPGRVIADLRAALGEHGMIAADPGWIGLWVARTFPTTALGSVIVPASGPPGVAAALAFVAGRRGRPAIAATEWPLGDITSGVLEEARRVGIDLLVSAWGHTDAWSTADQHAIAADAALAEPGVSVLATPVDQRCTELLVEAAGEVVAWGGLDE